MERRHYDGSPINAHWAWDIFRIIRKMELFLHLEMYLRLLFGNQKALKLLEV